METSLGFYPLNMTPSTLQFYDIALRPPPEKYACSPNPWKARFALNFKAVDYSTTWVPLLDISKVRKSLEVPASRKFADGTDYYTLPVLVDNSSGAKIGDSFDIATYLEETYNSETPLFPAQTLDFEWVLEMETAVPLSERKPSKFEQYSKFNTSVDAAFQTHVGLMGHELPFDPAVADACKAEFLGRGGLSSWDDMKVTGETRQQLLNSFEKMLGVLAKLFQKDLSGPFILGQQPCYADFIVGGWLKFAKGTLLEWDQLITWHNGIFGDLYSALEKYADTK